MEDDVIHITPGGKLTGEMTVPGDKSISHRAVMLGAVSEGVTVVKGFLDGADNRATVDAFMSMGVDIKRTAPGSLTIEGRGLRGLREPEDVIDAHNSGTTARLLTGLLSAQNFFSVITGDRSLRSRPMRRVVDPLLKMGACVCGRRDSSLLPLAILPRKLTGISYSTPVSSAQLKSAILLAGLYAEGETRVTERRKSRDHTERMLALFGADVMVEDHSVMVKPAGALKGCSVVVPGDISSAAFFMLAALVTPGSELLIKDVGVNPTRTGVIDVLKKMGGSVDCYNSRVVSGEPVADILVKSSPLTGVHISSDELLPAIDEFPVLCVAAALSRGSTTITGGGELRVKESDRIAAMSRALTSLGVKNEERSDGMIIEGIGAGLLKGARVRSLGDHRVAMALAIAAMRSDKGVEVEGAASVEVSFPGFFTQLENIRKG